MIECDARLASLYRRSFPTAVIVPRASQSSINIPPAPSVDYKILALSLPYRLRSRWEQFPGRVGYLVPESSLREYWRWRLAQLGSGLKVGISWRSGMMKGTRHDNYTVLDEWGDVFGVPNAVFVNLQYGQCQDELDAAAEMFGVEIVNFEHIDLKNDFEQLAALMSELDVVIAPSNAVAALGGALNVPVLEFLPNNNWIRLGKDYDPWYPSVSLFFRPWDQDWSGVMYAIAVEILRRSKAKVSESVSENALHEGAVVRQRLARAALLLQKGNVDNARAICEDLLTVRPDHAEALLLLGVAQQKGGESGKAEETYKKVVEIEPLYAEAFNYLGALYLGSRRFAEAEEQLNRALELRPAFNDALNNLGVAYAARRMFDKATECYRRAIAMSAGDATARYNLALALEDTGQADEAIVEYQTVLDGNEAHVDAWNNLGNLYGRVGRISESETAFRKAIHVAPDFAAARINLARLLLREGRGSQEAIEHLRKAVALRPGDAGIWNMLGVAYAATGCLDEAAEQFERALTIAPGFLDAVRNLGSILQQSGRIEEAKAVLLKGLSHQPTGSDH